MSTRFMSGKSVPVTEIRLALIHKQAQNLASYGK